MGRGLEATGSRIERMNADWLAKPGQIVILNGAPRSGKSSIVAVVQDTLLARG